MALKSAVKKKYLVFTLEYKVEVADDMQVDLSDILDKLRETGEGRVTNCDTIEEAG